MKNKEKIYLFIIIIIGIVLILLHLPKKQIYDGDELYSYTLSNSKKHGFIINNIEINKWTSQEELKKIFELNNDEIFSIISIYKNQARDVHPPFYYLIFHIISIIFLNKFSILPGIIINIISYIVLMIYLYKISKEIIGEKESYIPCILYTLSLGMLSTAMFIRMYMMVTTICIAFTYYFLKITKNMNKNDLIKLAICTYLGFMTHYFFLIYSFFISIIYIINLIITKQIKNIIKYTKTMIIPIIIGFTTFPFAFIHIFRGYRGTETQENLIKSNIILNFKKISETLNKDIFYNIMPIILIIITILLIYLIKTNNKSKKNILILTLSTILYFILTLKIIPILSTRYFYPIYPIITLIIYCIISKSIKNKHIKIFTIISLLTLEIITQIKYEPSWIIKTNTIEKIDTNIIYIIKDDYTTITDSQFLINYNQIYFTNEQFDNYKIINECDKEIIIKTDNMNIIEDILKNTKYKTYEQKKFGYEIKC